MAWWSVQATPPQATAPIVNYGVAVPAGPCRVFGAPEDHRVFRPIVPMNPKQGSEPAPRPETGTCPDETGAYAYGKPMSLMLATLEDDRACGEGRCPPRAGNAWSTLIEHWQTQGVRNREQPMAVHYGDGAVTSGLFAGHGVVGTRFDLVLFEGRGTPQGPWLGAAEAEAMQPSHYHWSGGQTKWFLNASSLGLQEDGAAGLSRWNQVMGDAPQIQDRLHAILGYRSLTWRDWKARVQARFGGRRACAPEDLTAAHAFLKLNLRSGNELKAEGKRHTIGATWFEAGNLRFAFTGACSEVPGVYAWLAQAGEGKARTTLDYGEESFHAPWPSPGRLGPGYALSLKCRYQTFGPQVGAGPSQAAADAASRTLGLPEGHLHFQATADQIELFQDGSRRLVRRTFLYRRLVDGVPAYGPGTSVRIHLDPAGAVLGLDRDWAVPLEPVATAASLSHLDPALWLAQAVSGTPADADLHLEANGIRYWCSRPSASDPLKLIPVMMVTATLRGQDGQTYTEHVFYPVLNGR
jgi:hypothetical protein